MYAWWQCISLKSKWHYNGVTRQMHCNNPWHPPLTTTIIITKLLKQRYNNYHDHQYHNNVRHIIKYLLKSNLHCCLVCDVSQLLMILIPNSNTLSEYTNREASSNNRRWRRRELILSFIFFSAAPHKSWWRWLWSFCSCLLLLLFLYKSWLRLHTRIAITRTMMMALIYKIWSWVVCVLRLL